MRVFQGLKRIIYICTLTLTVAFGTHAAMAQEAKCHPEQLATKYPSLVGKTIKIATDGATPPYSMRDPNDFNKLIGLDNDMAHAAFDCIGVPVDFMIGAWSGLLPAVIAGQADVMWDTLYYTPERAKEADFVIYLRRPPVGSSRKTTRKRSSRSTMSAGFVRPPALAAPKRPSSAISRQNMSRPGRRRSKSSPSGYPCRFAPRQE